MAKRIAAKITGVAGYLPPGVRTNADMEKLVATTDQWIRERTGITERHVAEKGVATSHMATAAAQQLLEQTHTAAEDIDLIIVATVTPDMLFPATACLVQNRIGASKAWGFDLSGACSGFLYALTVGSQFVGAGTHRKALVIGSEQDDIDSRLRRPQYLRAIRRRSGRGADRAGHFRCRREAFWTSVTISTVRVGSFYSCRAAVR